LLAFDVVASNCKQTKHQEAFNIELRLNNHMNIAVVDVLVINAIFQNYLSGDGLLHKVVIDDGSFKVIP
jgi:hypothetical protein